MEASLLLSCLLFVFSLSPLLRELASVSVAGEAGTLTVVGHQAGPVCLHEGVTFALHGHVGGRVEVFGGGQLVLFALLYLERNQEIEVGNTLFASNSHIRWLGMARQWQ